VDTAGKYSKTITGILVTSKIGLKKALELCRKLMARNTKETGRLGTKTDLEECSGSMAQFMKENGNQT